MSLRTRVIPSILNGVSKQPPLLRSPDQNEDELNTWADVAKGLTKRPPTELVAKLADSFGGSSFIHYINRDTSERYVVVIDGGAIRVFDAMTGAEKTVNAPGGYGYLTGGPYRAVTLADYTFIVNTAKVCQLDTAGADTLADPEYFRWLNRTPELAYGYTGGFASGFEYQYAPNVAGGTYAGEVASIEKLPETAANGTLYKVSGTVETGFSAYWVVRNGSVWDETVEPNLKNAIDASTMPHALVRESDGTFTFAPFSWAPRRVGGEDTNPAPSFVGRTINDVFFYQNRLGFLVDENMVFSCAGDFGNFWRNTVLDYIDSDVVDAAVSTNSVSILRYIIPFTEGLMAFADQTQFSIDNGESGLTGAALSISPVTRYEINLDCRPVNIGTEVYFCGDQNGSTAVWEYTRAMQGDNLVAAEVTAHVPGLIPAGIKQLVAAPNAKALFALTGGTTVYAYQFYWNGNEKIMSAWRPWEFQYPVLAAEHIAGHLYVMTNRPDGVYLERASLASGSKPAEQDAQVYLDCRKTLTGSYDAVNDRTTFTLPYTAKQLAFRMVRPKTHGSRPGSLVDPSSYTWVDGKTVRVPGNEPAVTAGEVYTKRWVVSRQFPQDWQGKSVQTGRLQLRTFTVAYADTAYFKTEVSPYGKALPADVEEIVPSKMAEFSGKVVGASTLVLNKPAYHTGSYSFQVYGDAAQAEIALTNDTPFGSTFVSAEWEGFYFNRAL